MAGMPRSPGPPSAPAGLASLGGSASLLPISSASSGSGGGAPGPSGEGDLPDGAAVVALLTCAMAGSSLLSLPYFYGQAGLAAGLAWTGAAYVATLLSLRLLLAASRDTGTRSYSMLGLYAGGRGGARAVDAAVVVFQFGTTVAYITILVELLSLLIGHRLPTWLFHGILLTLLLPAALAPADLRVLVPVSRASVSLYLVMCAFAVAVAIASIFVDPTTVPCASSVASFAQAATPPWPLVQTNIPTVLRALPIMCQAFVCQGDMMGLHESGSSTVVSPTALYNAMRSALQLTTGIYIVFGVSGLTIMGPRHSETVWLCLHPYAPIVVTLLELGMAASLLLTFSMTFSPCRDSLDDLLFARRSVIGHYQAGGIADRPVQAVRRRDVETVALLALAYGTAVKVPTVETVISMTGAVAGFTLAYSLPAAFWLRLRGKPSDTSRVTVRTVLAVSVVLAIACTACLVFADTGTLDVPGLPAAPTASPPPVGAAATAAAAAAVAAVAAGVGGAADGTDAMASAE